jgi:hypothetical protein
MLSGLTVSEGCHFAASIALNSQLGPATAIVAVTGVCWLPLPLGRGARSHPAGGSFRLGC